MQNANPDVTARLDRRSDILTERPPSRRVRVSEGRPSDSGSWSGLNTATADEALIVIPCLNEAPIIADVIAGILQDDGLKRPLVVVADGGSTDGCLEIVRRLAAQDDRIRLLPNPKRLQGAGVNLAALGAEPGTTWLVRVDAHAEYPPNYVSTLIAEARRTEATSVVVGMDTQGTGYFQRAVAAAQNSRLGAGGSAHRNGGAAAWVDHGHHALFSLAAFHAAGGYDESFSHNEDAELDIRLVRQGGRIWLTDKAQIVYHPRSSPGALWRQYFNYGIGRARTVLKHRTRLRLRQALPLAVAPAIILAAAAPWAWPLALPAVAWAGLSLTYGLALGLRRRDAASALSGLPAMIMHLAWSAGFWVALLRARLSAARPGG